MKQARKKTVPAARHVGARPAVFVGSSREGLEIARALQFHLHGDALVTVWNEGVFGLSEGTLQSLVRALPRFDFAVLVITPDDVLSSHDLTSQAPRDNVMFELGLFMGRLGPSRTFAVCSDARGLKLPSDLAGVTLAQFSASDAQRDIVSALGPASFQIRAAIRASGVINSHPGLVDTSEQAIAQAYEFLRSSNRVEMTYRYGSRSRKANIGNWQSDWRHVFQSTAPYMLKPNQIWSLEKQLRGEIMDLLSKGGTDPGDDYHFSLAETTRNTIKVRFVSLGLIHVDQTEHGHETWELTETGRAVLLKLDQEHHAAAHRPTPR